MAEVGCLKDGHFQNLQVDGLTQLSSDGTVTSVFTKSVAFVPGVTVKPDSGDDSPSIGEFSQPAGTIITGIHVICVTPPVLAGEGDIGAEVGLSPGVGEIVVAVINSILDGSDSGAGTTVAIGNVRTLTLVKDDAATTTAPISPSYTAADRTVYCNITNTVAASGNIGSFTFIIEYVKIA